MCLSHLCVSLLLCLYLCLRVSVGGLIMAQVCSRSVFLRLVWVVVRVMGCECKPAVSDMKGVIKVAGIYVSYYATALKT